MGHNEDYARLLAVLDRTGAQLREAQLCELGDQIVSQLVIAASVKLAALALEATLYSSVEARKDTAQMLHRLAEGMRTDLGGDWL
jgi:hypothetical protein